MARAGRKQRERDRRRRKVERRANRAMLRPGTPKASAGTAADPIRGIEPTAIDASLRWHIARTLPRMGERALKALHEAKVDTFQPRTSEVVVRRGRRIVRHAQLLLRTVFIGVRDDLHLAEARGVPGLAEIVSHPEAEGGPEGNISGMVLRPARLDPEALQEFADAVAKGEIVAPMGVSEGANVVVLTGPFASFPAVVEKILPGDRLKLGISIFGRSTPVELGLADVRLV